jgi:DNA-binding response OmpR family regulator
MEIRPLLDGLRILIVEDEPLIAMDHVEQLAAAGAIVHGPWASGKDAIAHLASNTVDLALIDFVLTDGPSAPLQAELAAKNVPFVILSGYPKVLVRNEEALAVHSKPMNGDALIAALKNAVETSVGVAR